MRVIAHPPASPSPRRTPTSDAEVGCCDVCTAIGGRHAVLGVFARTLLRMWSEARTSWSLAERAALLEVALLAVHHRSLVKAARTLVEIATDEGMEAVVLRLDAVVRALRPVVRDDVRLLHAAWDDAAACPVGVGVPPLSCLRPDLPLQRSYRALKAEARLVLLTFAPEAGHRPMLLDATVLARRAGLPVSDVHRTAEALLRSGWMERSGDAPSSVVHAWGALFLPLRAGPWAEHARRK